MNKTLLQQLYDGEIYPDEAICCNDPEYKEINRKISDEKKYFMAALSPDDWDRFEKLEDLRFASSSVQSYENFIYGFKLGVGLMVECFSGDGSLR